VVSNLEVIVERKRQELAEMDYSYGRSWLYGFERGLEQAQENLETARSEPFFLVLARAVPTAETPSQLLFAFMDVIMDEIDEYRAEQRKIMMAEAAIEVAEARARLRLTSQIQAEEESPAKPAFVTVSTAQEVQTSGRFQLGMMDGIRQWMASNEIIRHGMKIFDIEKLWKTV
jgi:hypothetical protein